MLLVTPYDKFSPAIRDVINHPCPISTLPVELLQEIFAFSMTTKPKLRITAAAPRDERGPPVFQVTALMLTWVCSQWRQLASSMPELWGTMNIYKPKRYCVELTKIYLSRSGNTTPLNLNLRQDRSLNRWSYPRPESCPEHSVTVDILKLWVPQAHRWRSIHLDLLCTSPLHELPKIPPDALSGVQEAYLRFSETPQLSGAVIAWLWGTIFRSPMLRTAYWHDLDIGLPAAPFSQLSEFRLFSPMVDEFISILPSCQRLKRLYIDVYSNGADPTNTLPEPVTCLPCLEYLQLSVDEHSSHTLDRISAPVLRELTISDSGVTPFSDVHSLEQFLQRSTCTLRALHLQHGDNGGEAHIVRYLSYASKYLAGLEAFSINCDIVPEDVIQLFVPQIVDDAISVPFPSLTDLELCTASTRDGVISSMVESRFAAGAPLWTFVCDVESGPLNSTGYVKDRETFERLQTVGLQVSFYFWEG